MLARPRAVVRISPLVGRLFRPVCEGEVPVPDNRGGDIAFEHLGGNGAPVVAFGVGDVGQLKDQASPSDMSLNRVSEQSF